MRGMSFTVITRFPVDPSTFQRYAAANPEQMARISDDAQDSGCIQHFFAAGAKDVVAVDEWESVEQCQRFFDNQPEIPEVMAGIGAAGAPETIFYKKLDTDGDF
jgi:hypothetical protein